MPGALAQNLPMPTSPVTINVVDVAGNLRVDAGRDGGIREEEPEARRQIQLHQSAVARAARAS
jgi:hypothetical protein